MILFGPFNDSTETFGSRYLIVYYRMDGPVGFDGADSIESAMILKKVSVTFSNIVKSSMFKLSAWPHKKKKFRKCPYCGGVA